ncbi:hypothetical protein ABGF38_03490 [Helcococcus ovis]|uniref:hypothetical protein n=1 Tax=Helcococcus ovis TaxID=72026 RepID=UPI0038B9BC0A
MIKKVIENQDAITKDKRFKNTYLFSKNIDDKNSLVVVVKLLKSLSKLNFGKRNTIITSFICNTKRI